MKVGDWIRFMWNGRLVIDEIAYLVPRALWGSTIEAMTVAHGRVRIEDIFEVAGVEVTDNYDDAIRDLVAQRDAALAERDKAYKAAQDRTDAVGVWERAFQRAVDERDEARRVLREVQWDRSGECPMCGGLRDGDTHVYHASHVEVVRGHFPACALAAVLAQEEK